MLYEDGLLAPDFYALFGPPTDMISDGTVGVFAADVGMCPCLPPASRQRAMKPWASRLP